MGSFTEYSHTSIAQYIRKILRRSLILSTMSSSLMSSLQKMVGGNADTDATPTPDKVGKSPLESRLAGVTGTPPKKGSSPSTSRSTAGKHPHQNSASIKGNNVGPTVGKGNPETYAKKMGRTYQTPLYQRINGSPAAGTTRSVNNADRLNQREQASSFSSSRTGAERLSQGQPRATSPLASLGASLRNTARTSEVPETPRESNVPLVEDTVELPTTDIEDPSTGWGGSLFSFTGFAGVGVALAGLYYWFQRRFGGNTKPERKLRKWEVLRLVSAAEDEFTAHSSYRPSHEFNENERASVADAMEERASVACAMTGRNLRPRRTRATLSPRDISDSCVRQSAAAYTEMPRSSYEPSMWERYSKGGKLN